MNLIHVASKEIIERIEGDNLFKKKCVKSLFFLIRSQGFNKIDVEDYAKGSIIKFKSNEFNKMVIIEYELGTLPEFSILEDGNQQAFFSMDDKLFEFPIHYRMYQIVQRPISSVETYIKEIGEIWKSNEKEIEREVHNSIEILAEKVRSHFVGFN